MAVAAGLGPVEMNVLTELWLGMELGSYTGTRGWSAEALADGGRRAERPRLGRRRRAHRRGRAARAALEAATDAAMAPGGRRARRRTSTAVVARLQAWGERCVAAGAFPADVLKRAAG